MLRRWLSLRGQWRSAPALAQWWPPGADLGLVHRRDQWATRYASQQLIARIADLFLHAIRVHIFLDNENGRRRLITWLLTPCIALELLDGTNTSLHVVEALVPDICKQSCI